MPDRDLTRKHVGCNREEHWLHAGLSWPLEYDLELMVLRQRDSMVVAPMVSTVGVEIADSECAPSAEIASRVWAPTEVQAPAAVAAAHAHR